MTTIKFTLKYPANIDGTHPIFLRLTKNRKNRTISLNKSVKLEDWSYDTQRVKTKNRQHKVINQFIEKYYNLITQKIDDFELKGVDYSLKDLVELIKSGTLSKPTKVISYSSFQKEIISDLGHRKKTGSARTNQDTLNSIVRFTKNSEINFSEINVNFLERFETFMRSSGCKDSTIGIRMRTLRSTINKAIKMQIIDKTTYPFANYRIPKQKNINTKEILTVKELKKVLKYQPNSEQEQLAKDMLLFSYYCRGINFLDLIQLKKSDIMDDSLTYSRSKTGAIVTFELRTLSKDIIKRYQNPNPLTPFLFKFIKTSNPSETTIRNLSHKKLKEINKNLKLIMSALNINKNITYYCARHTFATHLKFKNVSIDIIGQALGHNDINSTISYLRNLPSNTLDQIIEDVIQ